MQQTVRAGQPAGAFRQAWASQADAVSFDLKDSVVIARKAEARATVSSFLAADPAMATRKRIIVRINDAASAFFQEDLSAILPTRPWLVNVPRVDSAEQVYAAVAAIERIETSLAVAPTAKLPLSIVENYDSPDFVCACTILLLRYGWPAA